MASTAHWSNAFASTFLSGNRSWATQNCSKVLSKFQARCLTSSSDQSTGHCPHETANLSNLRAKRCSQRNLIAGQHVLGCKRVVCQAKKKKAAEEAFDTSEPWLGAIIFAPSANQKSYSFVTTLERLGLGDLSNAASMSEAAEWLPSQEAMPGEAHAEDVGKGNGTGVVIAMYVASCGPDLLASGSVNTVFGLECTRCLAPKTYKVKATFQLLLSATPVVEPTMRSMGVVIGDGRWDNEDKEETFLDGMDGAGSNTGLLDLDLDDKIHFPPNRKSVDLSKYFRDTVHLELPLKLLCSSSCKGVCFNCGTNLNVKKCTCEAEGEGPVGGGLGDGLSGGGKGTLAEQLRSQLKKKQRGW